LGTVNSSFSILHKYQTFWHRLFAGILDGLVFIPLGIVAACLPEDGEMKIQIAVDMLFTILWTLYVVIGHGKYGQTLGKKAMKIKVFDISEHGLIGYKRAFLRESISFFISIGVSIYFIATVGHLTKKELLESGSYENFGWYVSSIWFLVEIITTLTNKKYRAVHDFIAGSVVIRLNAKEANVAGGDLI
jgi:uncharacterized RDD family membrane protein YckC